MSYRFRLLDKLADRKGFDCGNRELNQYLNQIASQDVKRNVAKCHICFEDSQPERILGFFTLNTSSISKKFLPSDYQKGIHYPDVPIVLIGRLAVDVEHQKKGIGSILLVEAFKKVNEISKNVAVYAVMVDAKDDQVSGFYKHFGFVPLPESPNRLVYSIKDIKKNLAQDSSPQVI